MKISNQLYDILKYIALIALPAIQVFWLTIAKIWSLNYGMEIGATIGAVALLLGSLLQISNYQHNKPYALNIDEFEPLEDGTDEDEAIEV